jgi:hypothetical protein
LLALALVLAAFVIRRRRRAGVTSAE